MIQKNFTKREFIELAGLGSLGLIFWQCYEPKKEEPVQESAENSNTDLKPSPDEKINFTDEDVVFLNRNDEKFKELRKGFNKRFDRFPKVIALCFTTLGVQAAVQKAKEEKLKISVKSGGHSFEAFSCSPDSLLINLSKMNQINWLDAEKVVLQPACL